VENSQEMGAENFEALKQNLIRFVNHIPIGQETHVSLIINFGYFGRYVAFKSNF